MKLHYSKAELTDKIQRKALFATPIIFKENKYFERWVFLTNLHTGYIRASLWYCGKNKETLIPDSCTYKELRKAIKDYMKYLESTFDDEEEE